VVVGSTVSGVLNFNIALSIESTLSVRSIVEAESTLSVRSIVEAAVLGERETKESRNDRNL